MKCPRCGNQLRVTNVWSSGTVQKRRRKCNRCHIAYMTAERVMYTKTLDATSSKIVTEKPCDVREEMR